MYVETISSIFIASISASNDLISSRTQNCEPSAQKHIRVKIEQLANAHDIKDFCPTHWIGVDEDNNYHGLIWIWINDDYGVLAETVMRSQNLPVIESDIVNEILVFLLYEKLTRTIQNMSHALPLKKIGERVEIFIKKYKMRSAGGLHLPEGNPFSAA